jgi:hypothetical protein
MTSNTVVAIRCRPLTSNEKTSIISTTASTVSVMAIDKSQKQYTFNHVFGVTSTQEDIYNTIGKSVISDAHAGYNSCVFAYGLTGCFAFNTKIMLFNGKFANVQDLNTNDTLMGDDSTPRTIRSLIRNSSEMFQIDSPLEGFDSYIVNEEHIMVFYINTNSSISYNNSELKWQVRWFNGISSRYKYRKFRNVYNAQKYLSTIKDLQIIDVPLTTYLNSNHKQNYYVSTTSVEFPYIPIDRDVYEFGIELSKSDKPISIPNKYLYNCCNVRETLLLGILTAATYKSIQKCYILTSNIINIEHLVKSLNKRIYVNNYVNYTKTYTISDVHIYPITVKSVGHGDYYGFTLDGNNRFIGSGFNILHNSGKTHTMLGDEKNQGLTYRICKELTDNAIIQSDTQYKIEFSYMEIYSEKVYDLLHTSTSLEVRQHPVYGPYVEGLTQVLVENYQQLKQLIEKGNVQRTTASTLMNMKSSRSHAIATIHFTQIKDSHEIVSKINLVDLAGSERIDISGVTGVNLKEAININKSLSQLSLVISSLAKRTLSNSIVSKLPKFKALCSKDSTSKVSAPSSLQHINYRDSTLTWILKESLGGNSKTYMIATISPSASFRTDTLSTLQYAQNASKIVNIVTVNKDTTDKLIGVLKSEIDDLRHKLKNSSLTNIKQLQTELQERESLIREKERTWEAKLLDAKSLTTIHLQKQNELQHQLTIVVNERDTLLKSQDHFEKTKLVETAVELQMHYEKKFEQLKASYEEKIQKQNLEEVEKLRLANITLKESLSNSQRELHVQMRQFTIDRSQLTKQIQQLQSKIHNLDTTQHDEEERRYAEFCTEYAKLDKKIEDGKKQLEDLNSSRDLLLEEIQIDNEKISKIKEQYAELKNNFENEKIEYNNLLTKKEELHTIVVQLRTALEDNISSAKDQFATLSLADLERIKNNFDDILTNMTSSIL